MQVDTEIILVVITEQGPIKAKEIAAELTGFYGVPIKRSDINSLIYTSLRGKVVQDELFRWSARAGHELWSLDDIFEPGESEHIVDTDSIVLVEYPDKRTQKIGFTKSGDTYSPDGKISYINYKLPLALGLLGKSVGDSYFPETKQWPCKILAIE